MIKNCQESITPFQIALSDQTAVGTFNYQNLVPGGAMHAYGEALDYNQTSFQPVYRQEVLSFRLDDFIEQFKLPYPQHIKIDVDGIEEKILMGAEKTLANPQLKSVFVEINCSNIEGKQIIQLLNEYGFKVTSQTKITEEGDSGPSSQMYNYIFSKPHQHQTAIK